MRMVWIAIIAAVLAVIILLPKDFTLSEVPRLLAQDSVAPTAPKI